MVTLEIPDDAGEKAEFVRLLVRTLCHIGSEDIAAALATLTGDYKPAARTLGREIMEAARG